MLFNKNVSSLIVILGILLTMGCSEDKAKPVHVCDLCQPCESCQSDIDGAPICAPATRLAREECGDTNNVVWVNSCGGFEEVSKACGPNSSCQETALGVGCACPAGWEGENCDQCADGFDPAQDCTVCKNKWSGDHCNVCPPGYDPEQDCAVCKRGWSGDRCDACAPGFDSEQDCAICKNQWSGTNCDICPGGFDAVQDCASCRNAWYGPDCASCPVGFDASRDCGVCRNQWSGDNCDVCPEHFDAAQDCLGCKNNWTGGNCDVCPPGFDGATDCAVCANKWTGVNCDTCPIGFDPAQHCAVCKNAWTGADCNECPDGYDAAQDCGVCRNNWTGERCDVCPANYDLASDCTVCLGNWDATTGCISCLNHWTDAGDNCGTCPPNRDVTTDCSACLGNRDDATDCATCKHSWIDESNHCGTCPDNWDAATDCSKCMGNLDENTDCTTCKFGFFGDDCDQCRFYVDKNNSGSDLDGTSWETAFFALEDALSAAYDATSGADGVCEVWVSGGTYFPGWQTAFEAAPHTAAFVVHDNVFLYGSFSGTEASLEERDLAYNRTVLHGNGDVCNVVRALGNVLIDGFDIQSGDVYAHDDCTTGGGILYTSGERLSVLNSIFWGNSSRRGGAIAAFGDALQLTNVVMTQNVALEAGAALYIGENVAASLMNCTLAGNGMSGGSLGEGTVYATGANVNIVNSIIWNNRDGELAGDTAIYRVSYSVVENGLADGDQIFDSTPGLDIDNYTLTFSSLCVDRGTQDDAPLTDMFGTQRLVVDIGAYEYIP